MFKTPYLIISLFTHGAVTQELTISTATEFKVLDDFLFLNIQTLLELQEHLHNQPLLLIK